MDLEETSVRGQDGAVNVWSINWKFVLMDLYSLHKEGEVLDVEQ